MPLYPVLEPLKHSGKRYGPGSDLTEVEMDAKAAKHLVARGDLGKALPAPKKAE